jgi:hypothetical protein
MEATVLGRKRAALARNGGFALACIGIATLSVSWETRWATMGEAVGAGTFCGTEHAWLPQAQHRHGAASVTVWGESAITACIQRSRPLNVMFNMARTIRIYC